MTRVHLVDIRAANFRNLAADRVLLSEGTNLLVGGNGAGKTSCLEAVAMLGNLRSFRTPSLRQVAAHGHTELLVEGRVATARATFSLRQKVAVGPPVQRTLEVAGAAATVAEYLQVMPVLALSGADRELVAGPPAVRRAFLDRFTFLLEPPYFDELRQYSRVLRQRNAALGAGVGDREMEAWEVRLAAAAAVVVARRRTSCDRLAAAFGPVYESLRGGSFPSISVNYRGEATIEAAECRAEVEEHYRKRYHETRVRDRQTGFTGEGPHRHDVDLRANGKAVRYVLSSGQTKVVAAALRLASLTDVEEHRGERFPVVIDDVDAELDPRVLSRLIGHLEGERQLLLSSAIGAVSGQLGGRAKRYLVSEGTITGQAGERAHE